MRRDPEELGYIEAELTLRPTEAGGRKSAVQSGYRPNWWVPGDRERVFASAVLEVVDSSEITQGARGTVRLYPLAPELWEYVRIGSELDMCEGPAKMGDAKVTRIVPAAAPVGRS